MIFIGKFKKYIITDKNGRKNTVHFMCVTILWKVTNILKEFVYKHESSKFEIIASLMNIKHLFATENLEYYV